MRTAEAARGKWAGVFRHFGVDDRYLNPKRHTDCPLCGEGKDRFRFSDRDGTGVFFCNQCHPNGGSPFDFLMAWTGKPFKEIACEVDAIVGNIEPEKPASKPDPLPRLRKLEAGILHMGGINPVRRYLKSRGLSPTPEIEFNPGVDYWESGTKIGVFPAMLCRLVSPEGKNLTYHITHLTDAGEKAPVSAVRKIAPPLADLNGSAIRLFPLAKHIGVAEGVESALAAAAMWGLPVWACATANLLERFVPPEGVERVAIFGDNDKSFTGQKAAYTLANRLARNFAVSVHIPETVGNDFADEIFSRDGAGHAG